MATAATTRQRQCMIPAEMLPVPHIKIVRCIHHLGEKGLFHQTLRFVESQKLFSSTPRRMCIAQTDSCLSLNQHSLLICFPRMLPSHLRTQTASHPPSTQLQAGFSLTALALVEQLLILPTPATASRMPSHKLLAAWTPQPQAARPHR